MVAEKWQLGCGGGLESAVGLSSCYTIEAALEEGNRRRSDGEE